MREKYKELCARVYEAIENPMLPASIKALIQHLVQMQQLMMAEIESLKEKNQKETKSNGDL